MRTNNEVEPYMKELSPEELGAVNGGGFWDDAADFAKGLWKKTVNVIKKLKNWG